MLLDTVMGRTLETRRVHYGQSPGKSEVEEVAQLQGAA
jgi:hypothetical protein